MCFYLIIVLMLVSQRSQRVNQPPGAFRVVIEFRIPNFGVKKQAYSGTLSRRNFRRLKAILGKFGQNAA